MATRQWHAVLLLIALAAAALFKTAGVRAQSSGRSADIYVTEVGGIRRSAYPVTATVPFSKGELADEGQARLVLAGAEVPAQFTAQSRWPDGSIQLLLVDFNASPGPDEQEIYRLEYGPGIEAVAIARGVVVTESADGVQVGPIRLSRTGTPLLVSAMYGGSERISSEMNGPGMNGIEITDASGSAHDLSAATSMEMKIVKRGPLVAEIRYSGKLPVGGGQDARFVITIDVPSSKAWVRISTAIDDPEKRVRTVALHTPLRFAALPLSWDFGTSGWTYGALRSATDVVDFTETVDARRSAQWSVRTGPLGNELAYATSGATQAAPGWGHFQDAKTAVAFAVNQFGRFPGTSSVLVDGSGHLTFRLTPSKPAATQELTVYEHFVSPPVQVTVATSPAAILSPLLAACDRNRYASSGVAIPPDWVDPRKVR